MTIIEVTFSGWNSIAYPITNLWITCLMFWAFITPAEEEFVDPSTDLLRIIWPIIILSSGSILAFYQFKQDITWQFALTNLLTYLSPLILFMGLSLGHNKWFRLPSKKFWIRLLPLILLVSFVKVIISMPFYIIQHRFVQELQEETLYPIEELGAIEELETISITPFILLHSTLSVNFFEEVNRLSSYLSGVTNPILNSALWAASHDFDANRWSEITNLTRLDKPKLWLTLENLGFITLMIVLGIVFMRLFLWEKSLWSVFILHYASNILPELLVNILLS